MKYFTLKEMTKSDTAIRRRISNVPNEQEKQNIYQLVEKILDPLREAYGKPIIVSSGFRCEKLNTAVGGSKTSQHKTGQAADIRSLEDTREENKKLFDLIKKLTKIYTDYDKPLRIAKSNEILLGIMIEMIEKHSTKKNTYTKKLPRKYPFHSRGTAPHHCPWQCPEICPACR